MRLHRFRGARVDKHLVPANRLLYNRLDSLGLLLALVNNLAQNRAGTDIISTHARVRIQPSRFLMATAFQQGADTAHCRKGDANDAPNPHCNPYAGQPEVESVPSHREAVLCVGGN